MNKDNALQSATMMIAPHSNTAMHTVCANALCKKCSMQCVVLLCTMCSLQTPTLAACCWCFCDCHMFLVVVVVLPPHKHCVHGKQVIQFCVLAMPLKTLQTPQSTPMPCPAMHTLHFVSFGCLISLVACLLLFLLLLMMMAMPRHLVTFLAVLPSTFHAAVPFFVVLCCVHLFTQQQCHQ